MNMKPLHKSAQIVLTCLLTLHVANPMISQVQTVGTIVYDPSMYHDGYTLIYPHNQHRTLLLNACGEVVHSWDLEENMRPGNVSYLQPNGDLVLTSREASVGDDPIWAGGGGANIQRRNWDNEVLWSFSLNDSTARLHHDIEILPNGNVLAICWERIDSLGAIDAGRNPTYLTEGELWSDKVIEIAPDEDSGAEIVWEWRAWDHLIQDFDSTKSNYGIVADHPNKINLNYGSSNETSADWLHINSIDYYGYYDLSGQILLSIPTFDEVWVMWHDFPAEDDVLWRWGNPAAYNRGDSTDQKLFFQHDAHWGESDMALSPGQPEFTQICVFNNRVPTDSVETHSEVATISVVFDEYEGGYELDPSTGTFEPDDFNWVYTEDALNSTGLSSFQWLGDGSYLICNGRTGQLLENSGDGTRIWEYRTPLIGGAPVEQGTALEANQNMTFGAYRYPSDYSAFENHDVSLGTPLELNPVPLEVCEVSSVDDLSSKSSWNLYPNPSEGMIELSWNESFLIDHDLQIFHADGRLVLTASIRAGTTHWSHDLSGLPDGLYLLQSSTNRSLNFRFIKMN